MKSKLLTNAVRWTLLSMPLCSCATTAGPRSGPTAGEYAIVAGGAMFGIAGGLVAGAVVAGMEHDRQAEASSTTTEYLKPDSSNRAKPVVTQTKKVNGAKTAKDGNGTEYLVQ